MKDLFNLISANLSAVRSKVYTLCICLLFLSLYGQSQSVFMYAKRMGGSGDDQGRAVTMDPAGNVYATGYFNATVDFDPGPGIYDLTSVGENDVFVCKFDAVGNFLWAKRFGGVGDDQPNGIAIDPGGNLLITGSFYLTGDFDPDAGVANLTSSAAKDAFICKITGAGSYIWAKKIGGSGEDQGNSIAVDAAGNVYTTGFFQNTVDFDPSASVYNLGSSGGTDIFVNRLDASGNHVYTRKMGGSGNETGNAIKIDPSGDILTTGIYEGTGDYNPGGLVFNLTSAGGNDVFISKLSSTGNFIWAKSIGGPGSDVATALIGNAAGEVYTTGYFDNSVDADPGVVIQPLISSGGSDIFVSKLNASGSYMWGVKIGGSGNEQCHAMHIDPSGSIFLTGYFNGSMSDFDPGVGVWNMSTAGGDDIFECRLTSTGSFIAAVRMGGSGDDVGKAILIDQNGDIVSTGSFQTTADFDPSAGTYNLSVVAGTDIFIKKLSYLTLLSTNSLNLTVKEVNKTVSLIWTVENGNNRQGFTVEKSLDGNSYQPIGYVEGSSNAGTSFRYQDATPSKGKIYYRIRRTGENMKLSYSNVAVTELKGIGMLKLKAYAVSGTVNISINGQPGHKMNIKVLDLAGKELHTGIHEMKAEEHTLQLRLNNLTGGGLYIVHISNGAEQQSLILRHN